MEMGARPMTVSMLPDLLRLFCWKCVICGHWNLGVKPCTGCEELAKYRAERKEEAERVMMEARG